MSGNVKGRYEVQKSFVVLLAILLSANAFAEGSDIATFNEAWLTYEAAAESDDAGLVIETAANVLDAGKRIFAEDDERLVAITHNYGLALSDAGKREDAVPVLKEAVRLGRLAYGKVSVDLIPILADLADAEAKPFSPAPQINSYKKALKIATSNFGGQSVEYADLAFRASRNVFLMSLSMHGRRYMSEARDIYASLPEPMTQNVGMADFYLGKMEFTDRDYRNSSRYLESALENFSGPGETNQALRLLTRALLVQAYEHRNLTEQATQHCVAIGRESQFSPDQDYEPLFRIAPMYPASMLRSGKTGHVDIEFAISESGFVQDPVVVARKINGVERSRSSDFDKAAMAAVKRFRYAPKFEDGVAVAVTGVKTRISFALEN